MVRVDPGGAALRAVRTNVHQRRQYSVAGGNSLWHFDGNHKLIRLTNFPSLFIPKQLS